MREGLAEDIQTRMGRVDAYGLDIDMSFAIAKGLVVVVAAIVTVVVGLENVRVQHWIRKMKYHDDVRLPRGLPKIVHLTRMCQIDLFHCSDLMQRRIRPRHPR